MVDGSNESLEHADQEYDPILRKGITLQNSFEKVDVPTIKVSREGFPNIQPFVRKKSMVCYGFFHFLQNY